MKFCKVWLIAHRTDNGEETFIDKDEYFTVRRKHSPFLKAYLKSSKMLGFFSLCIFYTYVFMYKNNF